MRVLVSSCVRLTPMIAVLALLLLLTPRGLAQKARANSQAAATEHPLATRTALELLAKNGNAVDAMAAAVLVAGVVSPTSSGIGGGGFALIYRPKGEPAVILDFRETAPRGLDPSTFEDASKHEQRGKLVGVPGEVAGLYEMNRRFGKLPWAQIVEPAERLARRGFAVGAHLARSLGERVQSELVKDPSLKALYYPGGRPLAVGRTMRNEKLANTLRRIGAEGPSALYQGVIAAEIAATVQAAGGTLSTRDLEEYRVRERAPLSAQWAGHTVLTMPPPSAGGVFLLQTLGMFTPEELKQFGWGTGVTQHLLAEAFRANLADRITSIGDPEHVPVDVRRLLNETRLAERRKQLAIDRTHTVPLFISREQGTHHLSVMDSAGMAVALTTTVNRTFGAKLVTPASGIVLNDELADFTLPGEIEKFGIQNGPNAPKPLARPVSSMTPTIAVRNGQAVLAMGGSGGPTIQTNVTQLAIGRLAFGKSPEELVGAPRFYVFERGHSIRLEPGAPQALLDDLTYRGERVGSMPFLTSAVQIIARDENGISAAADARKFGSAEVR